MIRYILQRLLLMVPVMLGLIIIIFTLMYVTPGDPAYSMLGDNATPAQVLSIHKELKLDDPYIVRLSRYVVGVLHGDFGISYRSKQPVMTEILHRFPYTLKLALFSTLLAIIIGVFAGVVSAVKQYSALDKILTSFSLIGVSAPSFWLAMILVLIFALQLHLLPPTGSYGFQYWILPVFTLGLQASASIMRMTRTSMLEVVRQDYIRTSRAKGQNELVTIIRHAFRNALIPVVTVIGLQISHFLAGAVLIETVFAIPGLGKYIVDSVGYKDYPVVQGGVLWIGFNCIIINLITDILYFFIDPRIKSMYAIKKRSNKVKSGPAAWQEGN